MSVAQSFLLSGLVCVGLSGCGGTPELGPATSTPKVDQKKMEEEMKKSAEKGGFKPPQQATPPAGQ